MDDEAVGGSGEGVASELVEGMELLDDGSVGGGDGELGVVVPPPPRDISGLDPLSIDLIVKKVLSFLVGRDKSTMITTGQLEVYRSVCKTWYKISNDYFNDAGGERSITFRGALEYMDKVDGGEGDGKRIINKLEYYLNGPLSCEEGGCTEFNFEPCFFAPRALFRDGLLATANNLLFNVFAHQCHQVLKKIKLEFDSGKCPLGTDWEESANHLMKSGISFPSLEAVSVMVKFSRSLQHKSDPQITSDAEIDHFLAMEGLLRSFLNKSPNLQELEYGCKSDANEAFLERHEQDSYSLLPNFPPSVKKIKLDVDCSDGRLERSLVDGVNLTQRKLTQFSYKYSGKKFSMMAPILQKILELHASTLTDFELELVLAVVIDPPPAQQVLLAVPDMPELKRLSISRFALLVLSFPEDVEASFPKLEKLTLNALPRDPNLLNRFNFKRLSEVKFCWMNEYEATGPSAATNFLTSNFSHLTRAKFEQPFQFLVDLPIIFSHLEHLEELFLVVGPPLTIDHKEISLDSLLTGIPALKCSEIILSEEVDKDWGNLLRSALVGVEEKGTLLNLKGLKKLCLDVRSVTIPVPVVITDLGAEFILQMQSLQVLDISLCAVTEPTVCKLGKRFYINYKRISTEIDKEQISDPTKVAQDMVEFANSQDVHGHRWCHLFMNSTSRRGSRFVVV